MEEDIRRLEEDIQRLEEAGKRRDAKLDELTVNMAASGAGSGVAREAPGRYAEHPEQYFIRDNRRAVCACRRIVRGAFAPARAKMASAGPIFVNPSSAKPNVAIGLITDEMANKLLRRNLFSPAKPPPILTSEGGPND